MLGTTVCQGCQQYQCMLEFFWVSTIGWCLNLYPRVRIAVARASWISTWGNLEKEWLHFVTYVLGKLFFTVC